MDFSQEVLGKATVTTLQERIARPVLEIGTDKFTRAQLAKVECFNYVACRLLTRVLQDLSVKSARDLYDHVPPEALALPTVGVFSLAVLGAAFELEGVGGATPLVTWMRKHHDNGQGVVTFQTIKARELEDTRKERTERKARKHARRNAAHAKRVKRFEARTS